MEIAVGYFGACLVSSMGKWLQGQNQSSPTKTRRCVLHSVKTVKWRPGSFHPRYERSTPLIFFLERKRIAWCIMYLWSGRWFEIFPVLLANYRIHLTLDVLDSIPNRCSKCGVSLRVHLFIDEISSAAWWWWIVTSLILGILNVPASPSLAEMLKTGQKRSHLANIWSSRILEGTHILLN